MHKGEEKYEKTQLELNLYNASHCHHAGKVLVDYAKWSAESSLNTTDIN